MFVTVPEKTILFLTFVKQLCKDAIFPVFCLQCHKEGELLCESCQKTLKLSEIFACPVCKIATPNGKTCEGCFEKSFLDNHGALFLYEEKSLGARLIHELKYNYIEEAVQSFQVPLVSFYQNHSQFFENFDCITPVPLHPRRLAERGFNQSELIAQLFQKQFSLPIKNYVSRTRVTRPQVGLAQAEREKNVAGAFTGNPDCRNKNILLVDDVFTTGSTLQACSEALKEHGAARVGAFTLARAL